MKIDVNYRNVYIAMYILVLLPNFSPRCPDIQSTNAIENTITSNEIPNFRIERHWECFATGNIPVFADALKWRSFDNYRDKPTSFPYRKLLRRRHRVTMAIRRRFLRQYWKSIYRTRKKSPEELEKDRKMLESTLLELNSQNEEENEETCGTRWTKTLNEDWNSKFQPLKTYGTVDGSSLSSDTRNRRHTHDAIVRSHAIYFPGDSSVRWSPTETTRPLNITTVSFTAELWMKAEGGQRNPAVILGMRQTASSGTSNIKWELGIKSVQDGGDREAVYYFTIENRHAGRPSTIYSTKHYRPEVWTHLSVSAERNFMRLFVNGIQVAVSHENDVHVSSHVTQNQNDVLVLGGRGGENIANFRGIVSKLRVWAYIRPQIDIKNDMYKPLDSSNQDVAIVLDDFRNFPESWTLVGKRFPVKISEETPTEVERLHFPELRAPTCGQTVCDNPDIVRSYVNNWSLRKLKSLRYSVISVNEDDGSNPMMTKEYVRRQNELLRHVFEQHNITWIPTLVNVNNSSLRHKTIGCEPTKIGNRECNRECMHARLGHDGGDCDVDESPCDDSMKANGHCDQECNKIYHQWDFGDCCDPVVTDTDHTCFDPDSPHRAYLSVTEYRRQLGANNANQLSVLFANWTNPNSIGISTFPWDKHVFTPQGGTVVQLKPYTHRDEVSGLVHELGHNLGLLHVHHGSQGLHCGDTCVELRASMTTGDLCEDTNPTPMNTHCSEPNNTESICNKKNFTRTPYNNFMSYADGSCQETFTPQQRARMHCYIDLVYDKWREESKPAPIPLPPRVVASSITERSIVITWPPPIDRKVVGVDALCDPRCGADGRLRQYASNASSPDASSKHAWSAIQAIGAPDQEACTLRGMHFWMPSGASIENAECTARCFIDLDFEEAVSPSSVRLWVTYGTEGGEGIQKVEVWYTDGTWTTLTGLNAHCDVPLTARMKTHKKTRRIRVYVQHPYTAIDAVELISQENNHLCSGCRPVKYKIHRNPPFPGDHHVISEKLRFTDRSCTEDITYSYAVQPIQLGKRIQYGEPSPKVYFRLGQTFCGDGEVQNTNAEGQTEKCDDGNIEDGDGCDASCEVEAGFHCKGQPSLCYWHSGDGICEDFERLLNHQDCPASAEGYVDMWAVEAFSSSAALEALHSSTNSFRCSRTNETLGPPDDGCGQTIKTTGRTLNRAWSPCSDLGLSKAPNEHWIKMVYESPVQPTAVLIYLAPTKVKDQKTPVKGLSLVLPDGEEIISSAQVLSCNVNPVVIEIPYMIDRPNITSFVIKFSAFSAAIDAVAMRSKQGTQATSGSSTSSCVTNESFENANVTCLQDGETYVRVQSSTSWSHGAKCTVHCDEGYFPRTARKMSCVNGSWDSDLNCVSVSCGKPAHIKYATFTCPNGHTLNSMCNFTCWKQARMIGNNNTIRCGHGGQWTTSAAFCESVCSLPPNIAFATAGCTALTERASRPGETCKYRCKTGYHVTQQPLLKRTFRLTCGADGVWFGPGCQPVLCTALPITYRGLYKCTRGFMFGSICSMSCQGGSEGVTDVIYCNADGQWNASFTLCPEIHTACEYPIIPPGIDISCDGYNTGQTCEARCTQKDGDPYDIVASAELDTDELQPQEPNRKIRILVCTGNDWFPKPDHLYCIDECISAFIGDKWCDPVNNRAYCDWDGGDCCDSTTSGTKVERFPSTCTFACECKDPHAIENNPLRSASSDTYIAEHGLKNRVILLPQNAPRIQAMAVVESALKSEISLENYRLKAEDRQGRNQSVQVGTKRRKKGKDIATKLGDPTETDELDVVDHPTARSSIKRSKHRKSHDRTSPSVGIRKHSKRSSRWKYRRSGFP